MEEIQLYIQQKFKEYTQESTQTREQQVEFSLSAQKEKSLNTSFPVLVLLNFSLNYCVRVCSKVRGIIVVIPWLSIILFRVSLSVASSLLVDWVLKDSFKNQTECVVAKRIGKTSL